MSNELEGRMRREDLEELMTLRELGRPARIALDQEPRYGQLVELVLERAAALQRVATPAARRARGAMRSRRAVRVRVAWSRYEQRGLTIDMGAGGFAALLGGAPPRGATVAAWLDLGRHGTVEVLARVVEVRDRRGTARASFGFVEVTESDLATVREALLDDALCELSITKPPSPVDPSA
jgi:hypothetical protein